MNVIICGAGQVGTAAAEVLTEGGHDVIVVDSSAERLSALEDRLDIATLQGNCADAEVLLRAGAADDKAALVAATSLDEINLLTATVARGVGVGKTIARVHHPAYFENGGLNYERHLGIDRLICPEYSTAQAIAGKLRNPAAISIENFASGQIEVQEVPVTPRAQAAGKTLIELELPRGLRLAAIRRGDMAFLPQAGSRIESGDHVILVGNAGVFASGRSLFQDRAPGGQKMVIMGATAMGMWMSRVMRDTEFTIRLFEPDRQRAGDLAEKLDWVTVVNADPTDEEVFAEEHLGETDAFIGASDDDENNILACAWAKSAGAETVLAVVAQPRYLKLLKRVGIDHAFCPRMVAVRQIERSLVDEGMLKMTSLAEGVIDVYRIHVPADSGVVGQPLRSLKLTPDWMVAALSHNGRTTVPSADDVIHAGDSVVVIGHHGAEATLHEMFEVR